MITIKQLSPEEMSPYDIGQEMASEIAYEAVCVGNPNFVEQGNATAIAIIKGDYYDEESGYCYETFDELEKVTGKKWEKHTIRGCSQGDWQDLYLPAGEYGYDDISVFEAYYFGNVYEFEMFNDEEEDEKCYFFLTHDLVWKGKKAICEALSLEPEDVTLLVPMKRKIVYEYEEAE